MALKQADKDKIKAYGFDVDKLIAAVKDDKEMDYEVPVFVAISQKDLDARDAVKIGEGETTGEAKAKTLFVTEVGKKLNLTLKGERIGDLAKEIAEFMAKDETDKVKVLTEQVNALTIDKTTLEKKATEAETKASDSQFNADLISYFPANRGVGLTDWDRLTLIKSNITFEMVDGKRVAKKNGEIVKNPTTHAPEDVKIIIANEFKERPVLLGTPAVPPKPGHGGGDKFPPAGGGDGVVKTLTQAKEAWKAADPEKNVNTMSPEFTKYAGEIAKADKEFDWAQ